MKNRCPHVSLKHFMGPDMAHRLLSFAQERRSDFVPGRVVTGTNTMFDTSVYSALNIHDVGKLGKEVAARLLEIAPDLASTLGMPMVKIHDITVSMAAYGDGHFYKPHTDVIIKNMAIGRPTRAITACYYFHSQPRQFQGGEFRLYDFSPTQQYADFIDFDPENDSLVAFPSFARHEARPVSCPGIDFSGWRFVLVMFLQRAPVS